MDRRVPRSSPPSSGAWVEALPCIRRIYELADLASDHDESCFPQHVARDLLDSLSDAIHCVEHISKED